MSDVATWLLEQITEDERRATSAGGRAWEVLHAGDYNAAEPAPCEPDCWCCRIEGDDITIYDEGGHSAEQAEHIVAWDPVRVLAECHAKRLLIDEHPLYDTTPAEGHCCRTCGVDHYGTLIGDWPCATLKLLALPYAHCPGYREEWRP